MTKDQWITEFINELVINLRPEFGTRYARAIAIHEWVRNQSMAPAKAAKQWAERKPKA